MDAAASEGHERAARPSHFILAMAETQQAEQDRTLNVLSEKYKGATDNGAGNAQLEALKQAIIDVQKCCGKKHKAPLELAGLPADLVNKAIRHVENCDADVRRKRATAELSEQMEEAVKKGTLIDSTVLANAQLHNVDKSLKTSAVKQNQKMKAMDTVVATVTEGIEKARRRETDQSWRCLTHAPMVKAIGSCTQATATDYGESLTERLHELARLALETRRVLQSAADAEKEAVDAATSKRDAEKRLKDKKAAVVLETGRLAELQEKVNAAEQSVKEAQDQLDLASKKEDDVATKKRERTDDDSVLTNKLPKFEPLVKPKDPTQKKHSKVDRELLIAVCDPSDTRTAIKNAHAEASAVSLIIPAALFHSVKNLEQDLSTNKTRRFLFIGHGDAVVAEGNTLAFCDAAGHVELSNPEALAKMLGKTRKGNQLELVFLNGCKTRVLGDLVRKAGVPNVVCWETRVRSDAAKIFSTAFFKEMRDTEKMHDYRGAFEAARLKVIAELEPGFYNKIVARKQAFDLIDPDEASSASAPRKGAGIPVLMDEKGVVRGCA